MSNSRVAPPKIFPSSSRYSPLERFPDYVKSGPNGVHFFASPDETGERPDRPFVYELRAERNPKTLRVVYGRDLFSCKGFSLCPSCSQKRTLLFAEHLTEQMLLNLPHRQLVFALPKALRVFFRHDRRLFADVSRLISRIIHDYYRQAAGRPMRTGLVIAHQTFGDMLRWNPHFHSIVLEGGFDDQGTFVYIPLGDLEAMTELLRGRVVALLVAQRLSPYPSRSTIWGIE